MAKLTERLRPHGRHATPNWSIIAVLLLSVGTAFAEEDRRLNVLLVVIDDLRPELNTYGADAIRSPHIDAFAQRGVRFNHAYCQYPVCNPSRSSFLTGKRPDELKIYSNEIPVRQAHPELTSLPERFRQAGYYTAGFGKLFHQGLDEASEPTLFRDDASFDEWRRVLGSSPAIGRIGEGRFAADGSIPWCRWIAAEGGDSAQPDGMLADLAVRTLEERRNLPFFIGVGFHKPHDPFVAPKEYFSNYDPAAVLLPSPPADRTELAPFALPKSYDFSIFNERDRREVKRAYQACVSFVDAQFGKLVACMDRLQLWDNTIVVVMGDHGYHLGEHGWWNKVTLFELGARTPLIVWAPGANGMGSDSDRIVELLDLYPTLIDLCDLESPHRLSGRSLRTVLEGDASGPSYPAYTQVARGGIGMGYSVRTDQYRLIQWGREGQGGYELYRHPIDPVEYYNLAESPGYKSEIKRLKRILQAGFSSLRSHTK